MFYWYEDLHLSSLGNLVPESSCHLFYATRHQVYYRSDTDDMAFASTLIWYHSHKQIHTKHIQWPIEWHINTLYINTTLYIINTTFQHNCVHTNCTYYIELISHWFQKAILQRSTMCAFQKVLTCRRRISADQIQ